jgi:hypothetical protein
MGLMAPGKSPFHLSQTVGCLSGMYAYTATSRAAFDTVALKNYSPALIEQALNQSIVSWRSNASDVDIHLTTIILQYWYSQGASKGGFLFSIAVEPFLPSMTARNKGGAYPHDDFLSPLNLEFAWQDASQDEFFTNGMKESAKVIFNQAVAEGQDIAGSKQIKYGNYAPADEDLKS